VAVWQFARNPGPEAHALRQLLVRLSGRQMKRNSAFTEPALLAGLGVLLVMLDVIERYEMEEIKRLARMVLPGYIS
jgi:hypothetical protein